MKTLENVDFRSGVGCKGGMGWGCCVCQGRLEYRQQPPESARLPAVCSQLWRGGCPRDKARTGGAQRDALVVPL